MKRISLIIVMTLMAVLVSCKKDTVFVEDSNCIVVNGEPVEYNMIYVEGGQFEMGCEDSESHWTEFPVHTVTLDSYYIGETEVTQELWTAVMGSNPSYFVGDRRPVDNVSWYDCQEFISRLNHLTGKTFRLPTEAEWEYAARGGRMSKGYKYAGNDLLYQFAWYIENSGAQSKKVKGKAPNELGIYDMSGNLWEWCNDWYAVYQSGYYINPTGPATGNFKVLRGGSWQDYPTQNRVYYRNNEGHPESRNNVYGFRLVMEKL